MFTIFAQSVPPRGEINCTFVSYLLKLVQVHGNNRHTFITENERTLSLPPDLILLSALFPFPPESVSTQIDDFIHLLPEFNAALALVDIYFTYSSWWYETSS